MVLDWYFNELSETEKNWMKKYLNLKQIENISEYNFYKTILQKWKEIKDFSIPKNILFIISYVFNMYSEYEKLIFLYKQYHSIDVLGPLLNILRLKRELIQAQLFIADIDLSVISKASLISQFYFFTSKIRIYTTLYKYETVSELISQCKLLLNKAEGKLFDILQAQLFYTIGYSSFRYREVDKAIYYFREAKKIQENMEKKDTFLLAIIYNMLGNAYMFKGEINQSKKYYYKSLNLFIEEKNERGKIIVEGNIATLNLKIGKHKESLPMLKSIKTRFKQNNELRNLALVNKEIMQCLIEIGNIEEANRYLKENIELLDTNLVYDDEVLISSIEFSILIKQFNIADKLLKMFEIKVLKDKENTGFHNAVFFSLKGFYELSRGNMYNASKLLEKSLKCAKEIKNFPLYLTALKYYSLYLIKKLQIEYSEEIINELEQICEEFAVILRSHNNIFLKINFQLLLARIYVLQEKYKLAEHIYSLTLELCKNYNMLKQQEELLKEIKALKTVQSNSNTANELIKETFSLYNLTKTLQLSSPDLRDFTSNMHHYEKDLLINIIVIHFNGLPLYSHQFKGEPIEEKQLLLSGLFKAIESFSDSIIERKGIFKLIEFSDFIVMIEKREKYSVVLFLDEFNYSIKERLVLFAEKIEDLLNQTEVLKIDYFTSEILSPINQEIDALRIEIFEK